MKIPCGGQGCYYQTWSCIQIFLNVPPQGWKRPNLMFLHQKWVFPMGSSASNKNIHIQKWGGGKKWLKNGGKICYFNHLSVFFDLGIFPGALLQEMLEGSWCKEISWDFGVKWRIPSRRREDLPGKSWSWGMEPGTLPKMHLASSRPHLHLGSTHGRWGGGGKKSP